MSQSRKFVCIMMGEKSRLIQCSEILLQKGHKIQGIISSNPSIHHWANEKKIRVISPQIDFMKTLKEEPFDIFFSIDNLFKVPEDILKLPRIFAINFHDAPLPRYAGNNATSWAIINRETIHGVSWHIMTNLIDGGDILKQKKFPISAGETSLTLNAKCYEKSIQAFAELIDELAENRFERIPQDLTKRTFFPIWKRPQAACIIDWVQSAEEIEALFRGLDYGPYPNPLGLPKLFLGDRVVFVRQIRILDSIDNKPPGVLSLITNETIHVTTKTREVVLSDFFSTDGRVISPHNFLAESNLHVGDKLPSLTSELKESINKINKICAKHEEYWIKRLMNLDPIEIPYAKSMNQSDSEVNYSEARFYFSNETLTKREIFENHGDFLLSALLLYFSRIGDKRSFDINYRDYSLMYDLSNIDFLFASYLPLHIEIDYGLDFEEFYRQIKKEIKSIMDYGTYALDIIFRDPTLRDRYINNYKKEKIPIALERVQTLKAVNNIKSDWDLLIIIPDDGRELLCLYNDKILDKKTIEKMWVEIGVLLEEIIIRKEKSIGRLSILPEQESKKLFKEWNNTIRKYPQDLFFYQFFEARTQKTPEAIALIFEDEIMTYKELNDRANQLAHYLQSNGIGPDGLVGIAADRSLEMVVGLYGILKARGAYVPIDPTYPTDRIAYMLENSKVPILLTQSKIMERLPQYHGRVICLDTDWDDIIRDQSNENPHSQVTLDNLAYVIYTSGSTGKPKGVMITHRAILNRLLWMQDAFQLTPADRVLQKTPFSFDVSVWEFFWPLMFGGCLVIAHPEGHKDNDYLVRTIIDKQITTIHFVPSMLRMFLEARNVEKCFSLRYVICSGEALPIDLKDRFFSKLNAKLYNLYGPTEAAVDVTFYECQRDSNLRTVPIGRPIANTRIYILDSLMQPVPIGVPGEIYIGGVQVAQGYLNNPELTAEKFIPDSFDGDPTARLYKTGDLGRYLPDGNIEYLGRLDYQVKIRGLRIELGEIESVLTQHPGIREAVVLAREDFPNDKRLVAYIVWEKGTVINIAELRHFLEGKLPGYMIPALFVELETLPLTPNGKIDRRALPAPEYRRQLDTEYIEPQDGLQKKIASIWKELLRIERVGINDNFFDLGGNSLLLLQAFYRLSKIVDRELTITDMFRFPTIEKLFKYLSHGESKECFSEVITRAKKQREIFNQQRRLYRRR